MNLNKNDIIAIIAILTTVLVPLFGGSFAVLRNLNKSIADLDKTVAVMANTAEGNSKLINKYIGELEIVKDGSAVTNVQIAKLTEKVNHLTWRTNNEGN